jgi:hypothetical protein
MSRAIRLTLCFLLLVIFPRAAQATWPTDPTVNLPLCTATGEQWYPRVVSDGAGGVIASWTDKRNGVDTDIYVQRADVSGTLMWTADGVALCTATGDQLNQSITSDGAGGAIVAWYDDRTAVRGVYAQRIGASGAPLWTTNGVAICTVAGSATHAYPHIDADGAGGAIIAWVDNRNGAGTDIYAQRVSAAGLPLWGANGVAVCASSRDDQELDVVSDGAGGGFVTWESRWGSVSDVCAQRMDAAGVRQWADTGVVVRRRSVGESGNPGATPRIVLDGADGALIAWGDKRNGDDQAFTQRLSASGVPQWTTGGVPLSPTAPNMSDPSMVSDGSGGALLDWIDDRTGSFEMYAQRVDGAGTALWTSTGVGLSAGPGPVDCDGDPAGCSWMPPSVVSDGLGGAIGTWWGGASNDIYAQRVSANGTLQWGTDGVALCLASGNQVMPTITSDGCGGAIVVWEDHRNGNWDIYAQEVSATGQLAAVPVTDSHSLQLGSPVPNPTSGGISIVYALPNAAGISLAIYDLQGRTIRALIAGPQPAGQGMARWDGRGEAGRLVPGGLYFARLRAGEQTLTRRFTVAR